MLLPTDVTVSGSRLPGTSRHSSVYAPLGARSNITDPSPLHELPEQRLVLDRPRDELEGERRVTPLVLGDAVQHLAHERIRGCFGGPGGLERGCGFADAALEHHELDHVAQGDRGERTRHVEGPRRDASPGVA